MSKKNIRSLTLRIPENIHHKLKVIAALQNTTMTGAICYLVDKETILGMEQTPVIKSLLQDIPDTDSSSDSDQTKEPKPGASKKLKKIMAKRKKEAKNRSINPEMKGCLCRIFRGS